MASGVFMPIFGLRLTGRLAARAIGDNPLLRRTDRIEALVVLTAIQHPLDPNPDYAPKPVKLSLTQADRQVAEFCRTSCEENVRGFINTDRFFL